MTPRISPAAKAKSSSRIEGIVLGLFFLSGASALVYEVVWSRDLTNVFGGSAFAVATVLAAFMAGLALGSALLGRYIDKKGHPLLVYGLLEAGIAVTAVILPLVFSLLDRVYAGLYQTLNPGFYTLSLVRFVLSFCVLLIPTTMMGGTLPVLGKLLLRDWDRLGQRAGLLYAANTMGAVVGVAAGGFVLLPSLGLRGATWFAVVINLGIASVAVLLSRHYALEPPRAAPETQPIPPSPSRRRTLVAPWVILAVYGASGFAALAYEVAWTKTLAMILGNTTYAFTAMLTTFLLGLSLGSLLFARLADRYGRPDALLALVQIAIPLLALGTLPAMAALPQLFVDGFPRFQDSWLGLELYRIFLAGITMFLPTVLMGGTFPLVTRIYVGQTKTGSQLGKLYASNTVGAIFGSFLTGFLLIPWIGRQESILAASLVNIAAAVLLVTALRWKKIPSAPRWGLVAAGVLLIPAAVLGLRPWNPIVMGSGAYVYAAQMSEFDSIEDFMKEHHLLFYEESTEATVSVWHTGFVVSLRTNGKIEASTHGDMVTQKMISHLPAIYHQGEPKDALMIGLASGISVGALLTHDFESVETIELIPSMEKAARYFDDYNQQCLDDPRHRLIMNDGRNHLRLTAKQYDVIVSEPSNPWIAGVGSLFTREFFEVTKKRLKPGGIICQWVQTYQFQEEDLKTVLATFADAYPYLHLWQGGPGDLILVASMEPLRINLDRLNTLLEGRAGEDLAALEILPLAQLLSFFTTDRDGINRFVGNWEQRVTDNNLYLEYAVPRHMFATAGRVSATIFGPVRKSPAGFLIGNPDSSLIPSIANYRRARDIAYGLRFEGTLPPGATNSQEALAMALAMAPGELAANTAYSHDVNEVAIQALVAGDVATAEPRFRSIALIGTRQERAIALNNLGAIVFRQGKMDSARTFWERASREEPNYPIILTNLALLAGQAGDHKQAIAYLRRAIPLEPDSPETNNSLAFQLALAETDLEAAETYARKAVSMDPSPNNRDTLGLVLLKQKRWSEAESILRKVVLEDSSAWDSFFHLGLVYSGQGNFAAARDALNRAAQNTTDANLKQRAQAEIEKLP